jgi:hypothetical protein
VPGPDPPVAYLLNIELTMPLTWPVASRASWLTAQDGLRHAAARGRGSCLDSDALLPLPGGVWGAVPAVRRAPAVAGLRR